MAIDYDYQQLMTQTVTVKLASTLDGYAERAVGAGTNFKARVVAKIERFKDRTGRELISKHVVYMNGISGVTPEGKITLPDGTEPPILEVRTFPDEKGNHHEEVIVG